jgi:hypothetical protein
MVIKYKVMIIDLMTLLAICILVLFIPYMTIIVFKEKVVNY